jgi:hypothetical protein
MKCPNNSHEHRNKHALIGVLAKPFLQHDEYSKLLSSISIKTTALMGGGHLQIANRTGICKLKRYIRIFFRICNDLSNFSFQRWLLVTRDSQSMSSRFSALFLWQIITESLNYYWSIPKLTIFLRWWRWWVSFCAFQIFWFCPFLQISRT